MTDQLEFTEHELLADHAYAAPLVAQGVVCHGGFDDDGNYVSPRTLNRVPAIEAWQANHTKTFGTEIAKERVDLLEVDRLFLLIDAPARKRLDKDALFNRLDVARA